MGNLHETNPSLWVSRTPTGPEHAPLNRADGVVDVAVIGAGITGCSTALALLQRGATVALLESDAISSGATGYTTAKITSLHGLPYAELARHRGDDVAAAYGAANEQAIEQIATWVREHDIACDFERRDAYTYTLDATRRDSFAQERDVAQRLGLPASLVEHTDLPFPVVTAVRFDDQAQFDPRRYCLGLVDAILRLGGAVHESTRVVDVDAGNPCTIVTATGATLRARWVVLASHLPFLDRGGFFAKASPVRSYALAVRRSDAMPMPRGMYLSVDSPTRSVRTAGPDTIVVGGEGHRVGEAADTRRCYDALEQWAADTFPDAPVVSRWSTHDHVSIDGTPFVGRQLPRSPVLVATGFGKWGMTNGTAAAQLLADLVDGRTNPWFHAFDATRVRAPLTSRSLYTHNAPSTVRHLLVDRVRLRGAPDQSTLGPDESGLVRVDGATVAATRGGDGTLTAVSPICRHQGCVLAFNQAEKTWDCPCHGSRYTREGVVIEGPAVADLEAEAPSGVDPPGPG